MNRLGLPAARGEYQILNKQDIATLTEGTLLSPFASAFSTGLK
jgi:hypothetical protein